ncbi:MAG: SDR family oxidoreductase [Chloroflexota bacterium]
MKLLITGASGLLGLNLSLQALRSHTVTGVDRGTLVSPPFELIKMDLLQTGAIESALKESGADAVIHCAAVAEVDWCERNPDLAWRVNAELPGQVATACARSGVGLVHISTDAVFDGMSVAPYTEADEPHPVGVYALTKHAGERAVLDAHPHAIVARVNFYGWSVSGTRSLAEFFVNNLKAGIAVRGFTDVAFCPMLVNDLGATLLKMLEAGLEGLFHSVGREPMTKYEFGVEIARKFGFDGRLISADSVEKAGLAAPRAHNLHLSVHKLSTALGGSIPGFSTGLETFYTQYMQGYPQQIRSYQQRSTAAKLVPLAGGSPRRRGGQ